MFPIFGLDGFEDAYPFTLSGGMRQRAALMRTVIQDMPLMLLDEPFGALDSLTRTEMQDFLLEVWDRFRHTILFITHDIREAIYLPDRIYVMTARPASVRMVIEVPCGARDHRDVITKSRLSRSSTPARALREESSRMHIQQGPATA